LRISYEKYFRSHYGSCFSGRDVVNYQKWFATQWRIIRRKAPLGLGARVLEIGSGTGGFFSILNSDVENDYTGIELDPEACAFANGYFGTTVFQNISLHDIPTNESYDFVYAFEVLEHLDNPSEAVEKIYSILKPGGTFCGTTPFPSRRTYWLTTPIFPCYIQPTGSACSRWQTLKPLRPMRCRLHRCCGESALDSTLESLFTFQSRVLFRPV